MLASILGAQGTVQERDHQIERSGMYGEYPAIVRAYQELLSDAECASEALKRAVFLVWRGAVELPVSTGIAPLPDGTVREVVDALNVRVRRGQGDDEQRWMLAWYHAQSPDLLDLYGGTPTVMEFAQSCDADAWKHAKTSPGQMAMRGQMGQYWTTLSNGAR